MTQKLVHQYLPRQKQFMRMVDKVPYAAYIGGFGSGKTHVLCLQSTREITVPKSLGLIGAPTYRLLLDTTLRKFQELCPPQWIKNFSKTELRMTFINNAEIIFRSLDSPERLTNLEVDWFGLDEIGEVKINTFRMLQGRLRRPGGRHKGFGVGNPAGPTHWTYDYFVNKAREFPEYYHLTQAPSFENTFIDKRYTEEMTASFGKDSLYYKRFVEGQFVAFEGAYWANFSLENHIVPFTDTFSVFDGKYAVKCGKVVDFGFEHPFVCMWYATDGQKIVFYDEYWKRHGTIEEHCLEIQRKEADHGKLLNCWVRQAAWTDHEATIRNEIQNCHSQSGEFIGFPCTPAEKNVMESILLVQSLWGLNKCFITDRCEHARLEIPSYRSKNQDRSIREEPIKEMDDTCDCIRMACQEEMRHALSFVRAKETGYTQAAPQVAGGRNFGSYIQQHGDMPWN